MSQILIGKTLLKQYKVEAFIDSGGMKTVYRVFDLKRSVPLAMKMLHAELEDDPAVLRSFKRETNAIKKLTHPNIVRFYGLEEYNGSYFMLEEFIDGPSLKGVLKERKFLPVDEALVYFKALCAALGYAHANGVVHCDVKPGNVMLNQGGTILLTDFGIARHSGSDSTSTFAGAGTAAYMSPEQVRGEPVTPETDVYALGVLLFEMLTGKRPYQGSESELKTAGNTQNERIRYGHLKVPPPDPSRINPKIKREVSAALLKALEKDPANRYRSTQEFFQAVCYAAGIAENSIPSRVTLVPGMSAAPAVETPYTTTPEPVQGGAFARLKAFFANFWAQPMPKKSPYLAGIAFIALAGSFFLSGLPGVIFEPQSTATPALTLTPTGTATVTRTIGPSPTFTATSTLTLTPTLTPTITTTPPVGPALSWNKYELIDSPVGKYSSLAMGKDGTFYIAYVFDKEDELKLAWKGPGKNWSSKVITDTEDRDGFFPSVVVDLQGYLHISQYSFGLSTHTRHSEVEYDKDKVNGSWNFTSVLSAPRATDATGSQVVDSSLAVGGDGSVYLVYADKENKILVSRVNRQGGWGAESTVASIDITGGYFPIAVDNQNQAHAVYLGNNGGLWYVSLNGDRWGTPERIDGQTGAGIHPSLAFDSQNRPHVSYYNQNGGDLWYAYRDQNGQWTQIKVDWVDNVGKFTSLAIDKSDKVHISYYDESNKALKYATNKYHEAFHKYTVVIPEPSIDTGTYSTIVIDNNGNPCISYLAVALSGNRKELRFSTINTK